MNPTTSYGLVREVEFNIKELIWRVLEQWKCILFFSVLFMLLILEIRSVRYHDRSTEDIKLEQEIATEEDLLSSLEEGDRESVESVYQMYLSKESLNEYINNSAFMGLDPSKTRLLCINGIIDADEAIRDTLLNAYVTQFRGNIICERIQESLGGELTYAEIRELISSSANYESESAFLSCNIIIPPNVDSNNVRNAFTGAIELLEASLKETIGDHHYILTSYEDDVIQNDAVLDKQINIYSRYYNLNNQITNLKGTFSDTQSEVYKKLIQKDKTTISETKAFSFWSGRHMILGFAIGVICYLLLYLIILVARGTCTIENFSSIRNLGEWYEKKGRSVINYMVMDPYLYQKQHGSHLDREQELKNIDGVISGLCEYEKIKNIMFVIGSELNKQGKPFVEELACNMNKKLIQTDITESIQKKGKKIKDNELLRNDAVILIMDKRKTKRRDIHAIIQSCLYYNKPVLGWIQLG